MRRALCLALPLVLSCAACTYDNGDAQRVVSEHQCGEATIGQATIDEGRTFDIDAGQGAGLYIEYATGGHWNLRTSCDTLQMNRECKWDVVVRPATGSSITNVSGIELEGDDGIQPYPPDPTSYQFVAWTGADIDGFTFDSDPGALVEVDTLLDNECSLGYVFWIGDGALHRPPSNPIDLVPSAE